MVKIKIISKFSYQTYPIDENMIEVDENELKLIGVSKCFDLINNKIIDYDNTPEIMLKNTKNEIIKLKNWFDIDYMRLEQKLRRLHTLGKTTDSGKNAYDELIQLYQKAEQNRQRIQELEAVIDS